MRYIVTFIASNSDLKKEYFNIVGDFEQIEWLSPNKAADVTLAQKPGEAALKYVRNQLAPKKIDVLLTKSENRRKKLLLADMDSTIVEGETLDELAEHAGIKDRIAAITARAMNGELDFHEALRARISLLEGLSTKAIDETLAKTRPNPGAETFIKTMKKHGATCVLVSGGFTDFTGPIADQLGFDYNHGNQLETKDGALTGHVLLPILDKNAKLDFLIEYKNSLNLGEDEILTIGDGANDLPMLEAAGLGLGYHAKPAVAEKITNTILYNDLTAALYAQGYNDKNFA